MNKIRSGGATGRAGLGAWVCLQGSEGEGIKKTEQQRIERQSRAPLLRTNELDKNGREGRGGSNPVTMATNRS